MKELLLLFPIVLLMTICCVSPAKRHTSQENNNSMASVAGLPDSDTSKQEYLSLSEFPGLGVMTIKQVVKDTNSQQFHYNRFRDKCRNWKLDDPAIRVILEKAEPVSGEEWHNDYDVLPCSYNGQLIHNGKVADFSINAGAAISITLKDTSMAFGYKMPDFRKYFLQGPAPPSEYKDKE